MTAIRRTLISRKRRQGREKHELYQGETIPLGGCGGGGRKKLAVEKGQGPIFCTNIGGGGKKGTNISDERVVGPKI